MLTAFMQTTKTVHNASSASSIICLLSFCGVLFANNNMHGGNAKRRCSILPIYFKRREKRCVCMCVCVCVWGGGGKETDFCICLPFVTFKTASRRNTLKSSSVVNQTGVSQCKLYSFYRLIFRLRQFETTAFWTQKTRI